jgi:hypothetical protein
MRALLHTVHFSVQPAWLPAQELGIGLMNSSAWLLIASSTKHDDMRTLHCLLLDRPANDSAPAEPPGCCLSLKVYLWMRQMSVRE